MQVLGIDAMGGDLGSHVVFMGLKKVLKQYPQTHFKVYLTADTKAAAQQIFKPYCQQVSLIESAQYISMNDQVLDVLRHKKHSTLASALQALKQQDISGVFSVGNTGAMVALAKRILGTFPQLKRPALAASLRGEKKTVLALDLGANTQAQAQQLYEFAQLGVAWHQGCSIPCTKLALLNMASEAGKGPVYVQQAAALLAQNMPELFVGYCEANQIWQTDLDILICDGFAGNIALKSAAGVRRMLRGKEQQLKQNKQGDTSLLAYQSAALLLGVRGLVVKAHGASDEQNIVQALDYFVRQASNYDVKKIIQAYICLQKN